uniref:(California timema) hypothetical protein n=1 Tax=Timema californicum TaxID=61474 RepID=A0A7R9JKY9_TIMCA|nr:unnamed protein product [Timema californicum]
MMGQELALSSEQHTEHDHLSAGNHPTFLQPSESAGIMAGVFVGLALLGYVGLLVWRRILEKRYGNREMLVNEDDFYDTSDLKHFEARVQPYMSGSHVDCNQEIADPNCLWSSRFKNENLSRVDLPFHTPFSNKLDH